MSAIEILIGLLQSGRHAEAEAQAAAALRQQPLQAQLWVLLGQALQSRGSGAAAAAAYERAWLLDPQATWVAEAQESLRPVPQGSRRPDIEELLRCKPVTVTAGIIARDEERSIRRCIESLLNAVDDIVLVDCESQDRTVEIAREYAKVRVVSAVWQNDFAALRNAGLAAMNTDWVLWVDADEHLHPADIAAVREAAGLFDELKAPPVLYIWQVNEKQGAVHHEFSQTRMFPLNRNLRYYGRVHEQVIALGKGMFASEAYRQPVRIRLLHDGYEPEMMQRKGKIRRNLDLLRMMVEEEPDNPGWWLYYARESLADGAKDEALRGLHEAEKHAGRQPHFARRLDVYMLQAKLYTEREELDAAERACRKALELEPHYPDAQYYLALLQMKRARQLHREAEKLLRGAKKGFEQYRGTVSPDHEIRRWRADASLAEVAKAAGKFGDAHRIFTHLAETYPDVKPKLEKPLERIREQLVKIEDK
ncbi:glycosyltransferase [Paenibacillus chartarius]|uniref:Glycosyltransferase n=1 Tax=Paenibacillus chartarius TaxID=747481 RepID=A0ABV6DJA8_9BACL